MLKKYFILFVSLSVLFSCSTSNETPTGDADSFDRSLLLVNVADNMAIPVFTDLTTKLENLETKFISFKANASVSTFSEVKTAWLEAYKVWQYAAIFEIGMAEELQFVNHFNIYPVTVSDIENNITSGSYDLDSPNNHDAQGFPALDYLFYGIGNTEADIIAKFTTDANANAYQQYVSDIISKMISVSTAIKNDWNTSYRGDFVSNSGNTASSALNKLVNDFIFHYEKRLRANKIGIPAGNFSSTPLPEKVEAFYAKDFSKELAFEALNAIKNVFEGKAYTSSSVDASFKSYLLALNKDELVNSISSQLTLATDQLNSLNANLSEQINTNNQEVLKTYDELQKAVVLFKVDMLQAFNVSVDYVDADGD